MPDSLPLVERLKVYYARNALDHMVARAEEVAERYKNQERVLWRKLNAKYGDDAADLITSVSVDTKLLCLSPSCGRMVRRFSPSHTHRSLGMWR